jgi:hypothetical protein
MYTQDTFFYMEIYLHSLQLVETDCHVNSM